MWKNDLSVQTGARTFISLLAIELFEMGNIPKQLAIINYIITLEMHIQAGYLI